jgi:aromatic-L-amino-acid decarboxylase
MDAEEFRKRGKEMVDFIADYYCTIRDRRVIPDVKPGFMTALIPSSAPFEPETWQDVVKDIERVIMPGVTHWQHPQFHAYYPLGHSYPSILAEILCSGICHNGFSWITSPVITELELVVLDWLGKAFHLPAEFLWRNSNGEIQEGGGFIQSTASEAALLSILAARNEAVKKLQSESPGLEDHEALGKLIAYGSDQVHSSLDKSSVIAGVKFRKLETNEEFSLKGETLEDAIKEDEQAGLRPFYVKIVSTNRAWACRQGTDRLH